MVQTKNLHSILSDVFLGIYHQDVETASKNTHPLVGKLIASSNLIEGMSYFDSEQSLPQRYFVQKYQNHKYNLQKGDIILTVKGVNRNKPIRINIVKENHERYFISNNLMILRIFPEAYNPHFLYAWLIGVGHKALAEMINNRKISKQSITDIVIPDVDIATQNKIGETIIQHLDATYWGRKTQYLQACMVIETISDIIETERQI